jgi:hypothetical protein
LINVITRDCIAITVVFLLKLSDIYGLKFYSVSMLVLD